METEKELGVSGRVAITDYGIDKFNEQCRTSVLRYTGEWERYVTRQARWVDFENDYKTMDPGYMESVIWAFSQLWEQGLVCRSRSRLHVQRGATTAARRATTAAAARRRRSSLSRATHDHARHGGTGARCRVATDRCAGRGRAFRASRASRASRIRRRRRDARRHVPDI